MAVITNRNETVYVGGQGRLAIGGGSSVASDTMFRIASIADIQ
jgi:CubicO group peptidase (beta-lactamase class C family)